MKRSQVTIISGAQTDDETAEIEGYWNEYGLRCGYVCQNAMEIHSRIPFDRYKASGFYLYEADPALQQGVSGLPFGHDDIIYLFKCDIPALRGASFIRVVEHIHQLPQEFED